MLSSTPPNPLEGSGTFVGIAGLRQGLEALGHRLEFRPLRFRTGFHTLDRWLYNAGVAVRPPRNADLVYGVDLDGFLLGGRRVPLIVSLKGVIADELKNERRLTRALLSIQARWERRNTERADLVVASSRYSCEVAHREYGVPEHKLAVVPEPIDLAEWNRRFAAARRLARSRPGILCVARMYPRKRIVDLLEAAALMRIGIPDVSVRIVGKGPEWESVVRRHGELGLGETVTLLGDVSREQLADEYVNADLFCLPSVQEGFGIAFLEAMAAGLPVVACRSAAIPEVVEDGVTGVLVAPRDPAALATAMQELLASPERRRAMSEAGRRSVTRFTPERVAGRLLEAVRLALGQEAGSMSDGQVYATRKFTFSAAHRYWRAEWSPAENRRVFGNLTVSHGHNYVLEVTIRGPVDAQTGMVMDLAELKRVVSDAVIQRFDHADLNADPFFLPGTIPTTENLVRASWDLLLPKLGQERLWRLRLWEDPTFYVEYFGG